MSSRVSCWGRGPGSVTMCRSEGVRHFTKTTVLRISKIVTKIRHEQKLYVCSTAGGRKRKTGNWHFESDKNL